ncbi:hypothetical protein BDV12DRAFT_211084 [Aspergillus spectabilis]
MSNLTLSDKKHTFAIAQLIIFSFIHATQFSTRFIQERRYWHHTRRRSDTWCFVYSWWGMIGILAQLRIASAAMMMLNRSSSKSILITETILQGIGLAFLLFDVSLVLLRSGQTGRTGPRNSRHPTHLRLTLHFFRFPAFISIIMILVGNSINVRACEIVGSVGSVVLILTFVLVWYVVLGMAARSRKFLSKSGHQTVHVVLASLPFLTVRIVYFLLGGYRPREIDDGVRHFSFGVEMGLLMEVLVSALLIVARTIAEPLFAPLPEITLA